MKKYLFQSQRLAILMALYSLLCPATLAACGPRNIGDSNQSPPSLCLQIHSGSVNPKDAKQSVAATDLQPIIPKSNRQPDQPPVNSALEKTTSQPPPQALFFSGHSLLENPIPQDVSAIAKSLGRKIFYEQQNIAGSPIRVRTRGPKPRATAWTGYRSGQNRFGSNLDILAELAQPSRPEWPARYDALIITERHDLLGSLIWEDTLFYLRHFHDKLVEANPTANTWLYQPWWSIPDKNNPHSWMDYERAASPIWRCLATRINFDLQTQGRPDRIFTIPANQALVTLVDRSLKAGFEGFSMTSARTIMDALFRDDVHLTRLGSYYLALVTYASVFKSSPQGAWAPTEVPAKQAQALQNLAWDVFQQETATAALSLGQCKNSIRTSFCSIFWSFVKRPEQIRACQQHFNSW